MCYGRGEGGKGLAGSTMDWRSGWQRLSGGVAGGGVRRAADEQVGAAAAQTLDHECSLHFACLLPCLSLVVRLGREALFVQLLEAKEEVNRSVF